MFDVENLKAFGLDFATTFVTGLLIYVSSDANIAWSTAVAAVVGIGRASLTTVLPRYLAKRKQYQD